MTDFDTADALIAAWQALDQVVHADAILRYFPPGTPIGQPACAWAATRPSEGMDT
ncbi:MAG: hypothetical protein ABWY58_05080 [Aeromicrobium sp.]